MERKDISIRMSREEQLHLLQLQVDDNVIIKPSDKSKGFVVLSKSSYVDKCNQLLGDSSNYERLETKAEVLDKETKAFLKDNIEDKLPKSLFKSVQPSHSRMPQYSTFSSKNGQKGDIHQKTQY